MGCIDIVCRIRNFKSDTGCTDIFTLMGTAADKFCGHFFLRLSQECVYPEHVFTQEYVQSNKI